MDSDLMFVFLIPLCVFLIYTLFRRHRLTRKIPGPWGLPYVGSALQLTPGRVHLQVEEYAKLYGKLFEISLFNTSIIVLNDVETIHKAFIRDSKCFNDRPKIFIARHFGFEEGITLRHLDKQHRFERKAFAKCLHVYGSGISHFENVVQGEIKRWTNEIDRYVGTGYEFTEPIKKSVMNIMSILLIGKDASSEDFRNFFEIVEGGNFFMHPVTNTILSKVPVLQHLPFYKRRLDKVVEDITKIQDKYFYEVKNNSSSYKSGGIVKEFLHIQQTEEEMQISDETIQSIVLLDVLMAGVLSTSSVVPSIILCLVNHPEHQTRLQEELDSIVGRDRLPSVRDKKDCVFYEAVFLEATRLILPGPFTVSHLCRQDTEFEGYQIKANTHVLANIWFIHHDETIWGDPWNFRPDRFLGDDGNLLPNDHVLMKNWIPFGIGVRRCPGMGLAASRIFLYIATIFQRYTLEPMSGKCRSCDPRTDDFVFEMLLKPRPFSCIAKLRPGFRSD